MFPSLSFIIAGLVHFYILDVFMKIMSFHSGVCSLLLITSDCKCSECGRCL